MLQGRVDGLIVMSPHADTDVLGANLPAALPTVLLNTRIASGTYPAFSIALSTRGSSDPAPKGFRNHGLGSTPVISMMFRSAVLMSQASPGLFSCGMRAW